MSAKLRINTRVRRLIHYIEDIENGLLQIPAFQRDFVWTSKNKLDLFDSLKNGYPIGSILFWQPIDKEHIESQEIGPYTIPSKHDNFFYILDGFQRLSTILGCLINPKKTTLQYNKEIGKDYLMCYDLETEEFFPARHKNVEQFFNPATRKMEPYQVPVYDLIDTRAAFALERELKNKGFKEDAVEKYIDRYERLGTTLIDYSLPSIDIIGGEIEEVVEIFSRVNSKGATISPDWMISALSYNKDSSFRLGTEIDNLIEELKIYNFEDIKRELILQCITNSFGKIHFDQLTKSDTRQIEKLVKRPDFIEVTHKTIISIQKAVRFLFEEFLVIDSKLLPYGNQLVFITDFFNQIESPSPKQLTNLKKWFWTTTYANYFTIYSLSKQREAYYQFQNFLKDENINPVFNDKPDSKFEVIDFPNKIFFGSVRAKALLLFLLNYSNHFQSVDAQEVENLNLNYLFYDVKDEKGNFLPESAIPIINTLNAKFPKSKDMSFLLEKYTDEYRNYFLTPEMSKIYSNRYNGFHSKILEQRKQLIIEAERVFVESFDVRYLY